MKTTIKLFTYQIMFLSMILLVSCKTDSNIDNKTKTDYYANLEFDMDPIIEPTFPDNSVNIAEMGAVGDGTVLNSEVFKKAIDSLSSMGGGKLIIPEGIWLTGPIILKSNINVYTEKGALVIFSPNKDLYPLIETSFEGLNTVRSTSPIYGKGLENIAFTGSGVFDGTGEVWRAVHKSQLTDSQWDKKVQSGGYVSKNGATWYPSKSYEDALQMSELNVVKEYKTLEEFQPIRDFLRPVMVSLVECKNILFEGPTFQNSPAWCIHPLMCENLVLRNVTVKNPWYSQNGDGIDIESCKNVLLYNCNFDVGDDAICIKSGKDEDGLERNMPTENLVVKNCIVYHGHGGVTVGSEMSGGVKNMHVSNCTFMGTDVGLRFKSKRGRGGVVENIYISNIKMIDIPTFAISFNLYYSGMSVVELLESGGLNQLSSDEYPEVSRETPQFKNIFINDIVCRGALQAVFLQGLPEMNLENVNISNAIFKSQYGLVCVDADGVNLENIDFDVEKGPVMSFLNIKNLKATNIDYPEHIKTVLEVNGEKSKNIVVKQTDFADAKEQIKVGAEVEEEIIPVP